MNGVDPFIPFPSFAPCDDKCSSFLEDETTHYLGSKENPTSDPNSVSDLILDDTAFRIIEN
jgi:hypothetical protein